MTQKIVLIDTNVWVSAFINRKGYPAKIMEKFLCLEFDIVISTLSPQRIVRRSQTFQDKKSLQNNR
jgi:predicted nucleic acid-binding protein